MSDSAKKCADTDSTLDLRLGAILDAYLQQIEQGTAVPRDEFLRKHPDMADRLAACLDGIELFGEAAPSEALNPQSPPREQTETAFPEIAGYEIHGEIGRGGMGVVYEAREKSLDRTVALKVMRFGIVDPRALERFQREAETAGALHHTNIVPVYATGREGDTSWYAMQLIEGQSLAQRIQSAYGEGRRTPVSTDEIIDVGLQAAEALHHAHERDVVHRDVKPANLIVDKEGRVWLTDFGLARRLVDVGATMTGALLGTPRYMSPEQADLSRVDVDHRSDIYSLGATLYELATGIPPFGGDDPLSVISQIRFEEPPSPRSIRPGISRDLDVVLMKCLAKDSSRRYATAEELADDLRAIRDDRPIKAKPTSIIEHTARWVRKHQAGARAAGVAAIATLLLGLLAMLAWENWREYNQSAFRLRAAGGPYTTTIQPANSGSGSGSASEHMNLTVPMQSYQKLPHGEYDVMLSSRGRWSQKVRLPIRPGQDTEYLLRAQDRPVREVSIDGAMAAVTADFDGPAVLWSRDGKLRRYGSEASDDWTLAADSIETEVVRVLPEDGTSENKDDTKLEVDFAVFQPLKETPWVRSRLHENPQIATPARTLRSPIDIDADGKADTVVAAMGKSALMAIDANGNVLWAKAYDLNGRLREGNPTALQGELRHLLPGVIDIHDVDDCNDDGVADLVVQLVHIQPGIQNDVCLALLDGQTGDVINAVKLPALKVKDYSAWPIDSQLRYDYANLRTTGTMQFYKDHVRINSSFDDVKIVRRTAGTATFAVPSPMQVVEVSGRPIAIYAAGNTCHAYEMTSGDQLFSPLKLMSQIERCPRLVRLGQEGDEPKYGLLIREKKMTRQTPSGAMSAARLAVYDLAGKLVWEQMQTAFDMEKGENVSNPNQVDWPLVVDVNGDGCDEILMPQQISFDAGWRPSLILVDAATGKELWNANEPLKVGFNRLAITADVDNDGTRDFVAASMHGSTTLQPTLGFSTGIGTATVYVDWISGATGKPIMWASHPVSTVPQEIGRTDIDAIRCNPNGMDPRIVEVDFVSGGDEELEMASMTIQFNPSSHEAVSVATGLTSCASANSAGSQIRLFYKRPGPFLDGDESLVFLRDRKPDMIRVGESEVVATWTTSSLDGSNRPRKLAGLKGLTSERFSVIDVDQQRTLWSTVAKPSGRQAVFPIRRPNGSYDFLVSRPFSYSPPELIDGDTGTVIWTTAEEVGGKILHAESVVGEGQTERFFIVGNGRSYSSERKDQFVMSMTNAATGRGLWSKAFLHQAPSVNTPTELNDFQFVDVNDDGIMDVVGPEQLENENQLRIAVWDGGSGARLWMTDPLKGGAYSRYLAGPLTVISVNGLPRIAYVRKTAEDTLPKLVLRDALNGNKLTEAELPSEFAHLAMCRRRTRATYGALADCSTQDQARLCLSTNYADTLVSKIVTVRDSKLTFDETFTDEKRNRNRRVWLKDITGDATPERLELKRDALVCRNAATNELLWTVDFPEEEYHRTLTFDPLDQTAWVHDSPELSRNSVGPPFRLIDLNAGNLLAEFEARRFVDRKLPSVFCDDSGTTLVWPLSGGTRVQRLASAETSESSFLGPTQVDARRIGHWHISQHGRSIQDIVFTGIRSALILCAFALPFLYVGTMLMQRRWSLSFFLLAPLVLMLFLLAVRTSWFGVMTLLEGYSWLATPLGLWIAIQPPFDSPTNEQWQIFKPKIKWTFLLVLMLISFVALLATEYSRRNDLLTYPIGARDLLFGAVATASYAFKYWFGFALLFLFFSKFQQQTDQNQVAAT